MSMGIIESGEYNKVAGLGGDVTTERGRATLTNIGITANIIVDYVKVGRLVTFTATINDITGGQPAALSYDTLNIGTVPAKLKPAMTCRVDCHCQGGEVPYVAEIDTAGRLKVWQWGQPTAIGNHSNITFTFTYASES